MIIWTGRGGIALLFLSLFSLSLIGLGVDEDYAFAYGTLIAALPTYIVGRMWNSPRVDIDPDTGSEVMWKPNHTMFWIPMQYWGIIYVIIGIIQLIAA